MEQGSTGLTSLLFRFPRRCSVPCHRLLSLQGSHRCYTGVPAGGTDLSASFCCLRHRFTRRGLRNCSLTLK